MGRSAYLNRIAFGRSSHEHPQRHENIASRESLDPSNTPFLPTVSSGHLNRDDQPRSDLYQPYHQLYDDRGHPTNPHSRLLSRAVRNASNDVLSVIGVVEKKTSSKSVDRLSQEDKEDFLVQSNLAWLLVITSSITIDLLSAWVPSFVARLLVYGCVPGSSFSELFALQYHALGWLDFNFSGFASVLTAGIFTPARLTVLSMYSVDRMVVATVSKRQTRSFYAEQLKPMLSCIVEVTSTLALLPLRIHSQLSFLGLAPSRQLFPSWQQLIPFPSASPFCMGDTPLAILLLMGAQPISAAVAKQVEQIIPPFATDAVDRAAARALVSGTERPSSNRSSPSSNRQVPNYGGEMSIVHQEEPPMNEQENIPPSRPLNRMLSRIDSDFGTYQPPAPQVSIRISSYDPESSTVNLEIGIPEPAEVQSQASPHSARQNANARHGAPSGRTQTMPTPQSLGSTSQDGGVSRENGDDNHLLHSQPDPSLETTLLNTPTTNGSTTPPVPPPSSSSQFQNQQSMHSHDPNTIQIPPLLKTTPLRNSLRTTLLSVRNTTITHLILLPLRILVIRSFASWYISSHPSILGPDPRFLVGLKGPGVSGSVSSGTLGKVLLVFGIEAAIGCGVGVLQSWVVNGLEWVYAEGGDERKEIET